ncbi:MAG: PAS domain S-box protein [Desulfarculus sp.]|nr:PAS domain S-box protein [Desulfarculus sp.]
MPTPWPWPSPIYDMYEKVLFLNEAFEKTFGWTMEELRNKKITFVPPESLQETIDNVNRMLSGEGVVAFETKRLTKDGRKLDVLINTATFMEGARQAGNIVVFRDITEIKKVESALRESEVRYRNLVETISEGLLEVNRDNQITFCNKFFADTLGYEKSALLGVNTLELLDERNQAILRAQWDKRQQGKSSRYELGWTKADGGTLHCLVSATPLRDSQGNFQGSLCLVTDITERKLLESQLLQAQKLESIGQLAAGIAHEINTPTQYVSDNTRFLRDAFYDLTRVLVSHLKLAKLAAGQEPPAGPALSQALEEAQAQYQEIDGDYLLEEVPNAIEQTLEGLSRISTIVRSMKEFAHPGPDTKTPTDINRAIENTITVAKNEWKYVAEVVTDLAPDLPPVPCVPGELNQVFLNIIVNAAHAIGEVYQEGQDQKGQINISTRLLGSEVEIRFSDTGPGIPAAIKNRVFDPFFTTKPPGKGTGQGLAIAYRVIEDKHGGKLSLESAEGQGATFIIRLPLQESSVRDKPQ